MIRRTSVRLAAIVTAVLTFFLLSAKDPARAASDLMPAEGEVILTVSGEIGATNYGEKAAFDIAMLRALGEVEFATSTIWTEGEQTFLGVSLKTLLETIGVEDGTLKASAINDYSVEIPVADAVEGGPIIAYMRNGKEMSVRDKGPLWIVYPYDQNPDYKSEQIYSRSIWQLDRIEVLN